MKKITFRNLWKGFWEPLLRCAPVQWVVAGFIAIFVWLIYFSCRKEVINSETLKQYARKPAIFSFWHGRMVMLSPIMCRAGGRSYVVASQHADGRLAARLQRFFGLNAIYGSSSKGAVSVLRDGVRVLRDGRYSLCISPDGPSGPSLRVKDGALYFAKMTGAPIIPVCFSASRGWFQQRWDRCLIAKPFSKITCRIGEPIFIDRNMSSEQFEEMRKKVEDCMVQQLREMDTEFNLFYVEQDLKSGEFKQQLREARAARKAAKHQRGAKNK